MTRFFSPLFTIQKSSKQSGRLATLYRPSVLILVKKNVVDFEVAKRCIAVGAVSQFLYSLGMPISSLF